MFIRPCDIDVIQATRGLEPAFDRSSMHKTNTWIERCLQDTAQLWRLGNLWAITEVMQGKQFRVIHIVAMAGEYSQSLVTEIENWAVLNGCKKSYFTGRKGWQKRVLDYKLDSITMSKEL